MGLNVVKAGDVVSISADVSSTTGADRGRIVVEWLDASSPASVLRTDNGTTVQSASATKSKIEGVTVPNNTADVKLYIENLDGAETVSASNWMVNKGPLVRAYEDPPLAPDADEADRLFYVGGSDSVEDLQPTDPGAEVSTGQGTSIFNDDADLGLTAAWGDVTNTPTTLAGYGITDAEADYGNPPSPPSGDLHYLTSDSAGNRSWVLAYQDKFNAGSITPSTTNGPSGSTAVFDIGEVIVLPDPGRHVSVIATAASRAYGSGNSNDQEMEIRVAISFNGGSSFDMPSLGTRVDVGTSDGDTDVRKSVAHTYGKSGTPTGDIHIKAVGKNVTGSTGDDASFVGTSLSFVMVPVSDFSEAAGTLTATIPSASSGECVRSTSGNCTVDVEITANVTGGVPGYTYSWSKDSGDGSITSGSTSKTVTVSNTAAAADPTNSDSGVFNVTVTDSDSPANNDTSGNCTVTFNHTLNYDDVDAGVPSARLATCNYFNPPNTSCTASRDITANPTGGDGSYTYSWTKQSGVGSITAGSTTATVTIERTAGTAGDGDQGVFRCTVTDGQSPADSDSGDCTVTFRHNEYTQ